jgi:hypothetical protein
MHLANISAVKIVKNCRSSATAKYTNGSSIFMNFLIPLWKKGKEWVWYNVKDLSAERSGISMKILILLEVAVACTVATA